MKKLSVGISIIMVSVVLLIIPQSSGAFDTRAYNSWRKYLNDSIANRNNLNNRWRNWRQAEVNRVKRWYNSQARGNANMNSLNRIYQNEMNRIANEYNNGIAKAEQGLIQAQINYNRAMRQLGVPNRQVRVNQPPGKRQKPQRRNCPGCDCNAVYKSPQCAVCCDM